MLADDFCQLPPVGGTYLFLQPKEMKKKEPASSSSDNSSGFDLYYTITSGSVVSLTEVRRTENRAFIALQEKIRLGMWVKST